MIFLKSVGMILSACILLVNKEDVSRMVYFDAAEKRWHSILPSEFIKTEGKSQWCDSSSVVFQVSILKLPDDKDHREWMETIKTNFDDRRKAFPRISENTVSFKNWHGVKTEIREHADLCTYWFLSDGKFFLFASLIDRTFNGVLPKRSEIDRFFLFLEADRADGSD